MEFDPRQRREALRAFMERERIKVSPWERASDLGGGTLRKFMDGTTDTLTDRTYQKLAAGAGKLTERPVRSEELQGVIHRQPVQNEGNVTSGLQDHDSLTDRQRVYPAPPLPAREPKETDPGIPVMGTSLAGSVGDFQLNQGEVDRVPTPAHLKNRKGLFCVRVDGESMTPWKRPRQIIWLDPHIKPQINDHVVVELREAEPDSDRPAYLKLLVARSPSKLTLAQYKPARQFDVPMAKIHRVYRVMTDDEVMGISSPLF